MLPGLPNSGLLFVWLRPAVRARRGRTSGRPLISALGDPWRGFAAYKATGTVFTAAERSRIDVS